jgi:hypothetical protein
MLPSYQDHCRIASLPPGSAGLLPESRSSAGEAGDDDSIQPGYVYPELQGICSGNPVQSAFLQGTFECPPILGEIAGSVGLDRTVPCLTELVLGTHRHDLG